MGGRDTRALARLAPCNAPRVLMWLRQGRLSGVTLGGCVFERSWRNERRAWAWCLVLGCALLATPACAENEGSARVQERSTPAPAQALPPRSTGSNTVAPQSREDAPQPSQGSESGTSARQGSGGDAQAVRLHGVPVTVTASSVLPDAKDTQRYSPAKLLDQDPGTLWAEGAPGDGAGAWVELGFPPDTRLFAFLLAPGNPKSRTLFLANARPRKARLELQLASTPPRVSAYEFEVPRDFPHDGLLYLAAPESTAVRSARLTVLSVWPGKKYADLCIGGFVPVLRQGDDVFPGQGQELAPTLAAFMRNPPMLYNFLPPGDAPVWLRAYPKIPRSGPLPAPEEELDLKSMSWGGSPRYAYGLKSDIDGAYNENRLFRLLPARGVKGYVLEPMTPAREEGVDRNFRLRWRLIGGEWRLDELHLLHRDELEDAE